MSGVGSFGSYLSGFVHCFVGYRDAFRHVSDIDLGCSGAGFIISSLILAWFFDPLPPLYVRSIGRVGFLGFD